MAWGKLDSGWVSPLWTAVAMSPSTFCAVALGGRLSFVGGQHVLNKCGECTPGRPPSVQQESLRDCWARGQPEGPLGQRGSPPTGSGWSCRSGYPELSPLSGRPEKAILSSRKATWGGWLGQHCRPSRETHRPQCPSLGRIMPFKGSAPVPNGSQSCKHQPQPPARPPPAWAQRKHRCSYLPSR